MPGDLRGGADHAVAARARGQTAPPQAAGYPVRRGPVVVRVVGALTRSRGKGRDCLCPKVPGNKTTARN